MNDWPLLCKKTLPKGILFHKKIVFCSGGKMKIGSFLFSLLFLTLAACAPDTDAVATAVAATLAAVPPTEAVTNTPEPTDTPRPTNTPEPTPTDTPEPSSTPLQLSQIDLETDVFFEGHLPPYFTGSGISEVMPEALEDSTFASLVQVGRWRLLREGDDSGTVTVMLFDDVQEADSAYTMLAYDLDVEFSNTSDTTVSSGTSYPVEIGDVGFASEWTITSTGLGVTISHYKLAFLRCHAAVYIEFSRVPSMNTVQTYAQQLDERLRRVACE
jgi:hypothetical protein